MKTNAQLFDNIYKLLSSSKFTQKEIATIVGVSISEVCCVKTISLLANENKIEDIEKQRKAHGPIVNWAFKKFNLVASKQNTTKNEESNVNDTIIIDLLTKLLVEIKQTNKLLQELK